MSKPVIRERNYSAMDLRLQSLGTVEYQNCSFKGSDVREAHFEDSTLNHCDLTGFDPVGAVFRFSCSQGTKNKLDDLRACMYLYWLLHMFEVSPVIQSQVEAAIGDKLPLVKRLFDQQRL